MRNGNYLLKFLKRFYHFTRNEIIWLKFRRKNIPPGLSLSYASAIPVFLWLAAPETEKFQQDLEIHFSPCGAPLWLPPRVGIIKCMQHSGRLRPGRVFPRRWR